MRSTDAADNSTSDSAPFAEKSKHGEAVAHLAAYGRNAVMGLDVGLACARARFACTGSWTIDRHDARAAPISGSAQT